MRMHRDKRCRSIEPKRTVRTEVPDVKRIAVFACNNNKNEASVEHERTNEAKESDLLAGSLV